MTEKKKDEPAQEPIIRQGHTMADVLLTIYDDAKSLEGVQALAKKGKAVLVSAGGALLLIHRKVADSINEQLAKKAESIPPENRQPPDPTTAAKIVPALNSVFGEENLREIFLNLLTATMDKTRAGNVMPAFIEIAKQLSPDEALILRWIAEQGLFAFPLVDICAVGYDYHGIGDMGPRGGYEIILRNHCCLTDVAECNQRENESMYIDNMSRLGLFNIDNRVIQAEAGKLYRSLSNDEMANSAKRKITNMNRQAHIIKKSGIFTEFGKAFCKHAIGESPVEDTIC